MRWAFPVFSGQSKYRWRRLPYSTLQSCTPTLSPNTLGLIGVLEHCRVVPCGGSPAGVSSLSGTDHHQRLLCWCWWHSSVLYVGSLPREQTRQSLLFHPQLICCISVLAVTSCSWWRPHSLKGMFSNKTVLQTKWLPIWGSHDPPKAW